MTNRFFLMIAIMISNLTFANIAFCAEKKLPGDSIYQLDLDWKDNTGKTVRLNDWRGKKVYLVMGYTTCQHTCPILVAKLQSIEKSVKRRGQSANYLFVSLDWEGDTPEQMSKFREQRGLKEPSWSFLVGSKKATELLAMSLSNRFAKSKTKKGVTSEAALEIMHDNKVFALDEDGRVSKVFTGLDAPIE